MRHKRKLGSLQKLAILGGAAGALGTENIGHRGAGRLRLSADIRLSGPAPKM
jgi:hypothetical protein